MNVYSKSHVQYEHVYHVMIRAKASFIEMIQECLIHHSEIIKG